MTVHTPDGNYAVPDEQAMRRYVPLQDGGEATTMVVMQVAKVSPMKSDLPPSGDSLIDGVQVTVHFNSEDLRPPFQDIRDEVADIPLGDGRFVHVVGSNWHCEDDVGLTSIGASPPRPKFLPGRLLASWTSGGQRLYLSCTREVVAGRDGVLLNCGGGTNEQAYGRMDFAAMDWGSDRCAAALENLVVTLSHAPIILRSWKVRDQDVE